MRYDEVEPVALTVPSSGRHGEDDVCVPLQNRVTARMTDRNDGSNIERSPPKREGRSRGPLTRYSCGCQPLMMFIVSEVKVST